MAAQGDHTKAQQQLADLLSPNLRPAEQAAIHYEMWQLTQDAEHHRQAFSLYEKLADYCPDLTYKRRLHVLCPAPLNKEK